MLDVQHDTLYDTLVAPGGVHEAKDQVFTPWPEPGAMLPSALAQEQVNAAAKYLCLLEQQAQRRLKAEEAERIALQEAERRVRAHTARLRFLEQEQVASTVAPASIPTGNRQPSVLALDCAPSIDARAPSVYAPPSSPQVFYADARTERAEDAGRAAAARKPSIDARAPSVYAPPSSPQVLYADARTERAEDAGRSAAAIDTPTERSLPPTPSFPASSPTLTLPMEIPRPRPAVDTPPQHPAPKAPMEAPQAPSQVTSLQNVCNDVSDVHSHIHRVCLRSMSALKQLSLFYCR
jgi:hypothetical protein